MWILYKTHNMVTQKSCELAVALLIVRCVARFFATWPSGCRGWASREFKGETKFTWHAQNLAMNLLLNWCSIASLLVRSCVASGIPFFIPTLNDYLCKCSPTDRYHTHIHYIYIHIYISLYTLSVYTVYIYILYVCVHLYKLPVTLPGMSQQFFWCAWALRCRSPFRASPGGSR